MRVKGDCREARTRWELENKGRNVLLSVVRVVKVIWHLPYTQHSAIPVRVPPLPTEPPLSPLPVSLSGKGQKLAPASFSNIIKRNRSHYMSKFPSLFDPWAKRDAWRRHPVFSNRAMFSNLFPGFGIAVVAFSVYVLAENVLGKGKHQAVEDKHH